jgi:propanol-preferring alcohol dehydrogenase
MKAMILEKPAPLDTHPLRWTDVPAPVPGPGEVLIEVAACGVCRSNLHMIEGDWVRNGIPAKTPIIPGHEVVGRITMLGPGVNGLTVGSRVGVQPLWVSCERCEYCLTGREQLCPSKQVTGETVDGGYAEFMVAKERHVYPVPDGISDAEAAPLFCPGITAFGAVSKARLAPGKRMALFGFGGVGHMVQQLAQLAGAEVTVVARSPLHLALAAKLGAATTIDASSPANAVEQLAKMDRVDAAVLFAPSTSMLRQAVQVTKPGGVVVVGATAEVGELPFPDEKTVVGTLLGSRQQMNELLKLAAEGRVKAVVESLPLERVGDALARLKHGDLAARAVVLP